MGLGGDMKREHPSTADEAFEEAIEGAYYATQMRQARAEGRICHVPFDQAVPVDIWWDLGMDDSTTIWFTQTVGRELHLIDYYENSGEGLEYYAHMLFGLKGATADRPDGYRYGRCVGPHDIAVRELGTGKSRLETARGYGLNFEVAPKLSILDGIQAVRRLLPLCWIDEAKCERGITALESYRKDWNDKLGTWRRDPRHDQWSHGADGFRTLAVAHSWFSSMPGRRIPQTQRGSEGQSNWKAYT